MSVMNGIQSVIQNVRSTLPTMRSVKTSVNRKNRNGKQLRNSAELCNTMLGERAWEDN